MLVIPPIVMNSSNITSDAPTSMDPAVWDIGTAYVLGDTVQVAGAVNRIYECLIAITGGFSPEIDVTKITPKWIEIGFTNKYAMFDSLNDSFTVTTTATGITVIATLANSIDSLATLKLSNVTQVVVKGYSVYPGTIVYNKTYNTTGKYNLVMFDILPTSTVIEVIYTGTAPLSIGSLVLGSYLYIGSTQIGTECLYLNFSSIDRDTYGDAYFIKRKSVPKTQQKVYINKSEINTILQYRDELDAVPAVWSGLDDNTTHPYFNALLIYGFYREFSFEIENPVGPMINLELEEGGVVPYVYIPPVPVSWNPSDKGTSIVLSNGNLTATGVVSVRANVSATSGKKYYELIWAGAGTGNQTYLGIADSGGSFLNTNRIGTLSNSFAFNSGGFIFTNSSSSFAGSVPTYTTGDTVAIAVDLDAGNIWFAKNNVWINDSSGNAGNPSTGAYPRITGIASVAYYPAISPEETHDFTAHFSTSSFTYSPPTGFSPW